MMLDELDDSRKATLGVCVPALCLVIFAIFIALRATGTISWSYSTIFVPLFVGFFSLFFFWVLFS